MRTRWVKLLLAVAVSFAALCTLNEPAQASLTPAALAPVTPAPLVTPAPENEPVAQTDFSDAEFATADQAELGEKRGGASRLTDEELVWIVVGAVLL
ncbi:MAG TPA: hypothetical protein VL860_08215, partial [Planctomycetota bacterium]|nr:hypothetical protein [Planctomycetota bacterium]